MPATALPLPSYRVFQPHPIVDRPYWEARSGLGDAQSLLRAVRGRAEAAPKRPPLPSASDYLAARRQNDRAVLDRHWQVDRQVLSDLALVRCLKGMDPGDPDDKLLDWLWGLLTEPSWTVSAHLPGNDLPLAERPILDLASCEMAALLAEVREVLKPWMDSLSATLAQTVLHEIDRRVLGPYGAGVPVWWDGGKNPGRLNNWSGVCAGSILIACESLAAQGEPRPAARERALRGIGIYLRHGFTPEGECDEGIGYWGYGLLYACMGLVRLQPEELARQVDLERLRQVADYPRRAHLFDDCFFTANDGGLRVAASLSLVPWLAAVTDSEFLRSWAARSPSCEARHFSQHLRLVDGLGKVGPDLGVGERAKRGPERALFLGDQQVAILRAQTPAGELLAALSGGHNAERHNHNDLGHFIVALDGEVVVPDLGAPFYTADFFGEKRYTYLLASSRGHCCPLIADQEQRSGEAAAGKVLSWQPEGELPRLVLDLTAAYPEAAGLAGWRRCLECWPASEAEGRPARMVITDLFQTVDPGVRIEHVVWSLFAPESHDERGGMRFFLGPLILEFAPAPRLVSREEEDPARHGARDFSGKRFHRLAALYKSDEQGRLQIQTSFFPRGAEGRG